MGEELLGRISLSMTCNSSMMNSLSHRLSGYRSPDPILVRVLLEGSNFVELRRWFY